MSPLRGDALKISWRAAADGTCQLYHKMLRVLWYNKARRHAAFYNLNDKRPCTMDNHAGALALAGKPFAPQRIEINKTVRPRA